MTTNESGTDLGAMPEPSIEPGEPNPGGVDALDVDSGPITIPDLSTGDNPALDERASETVKQEVSAGEDTSTQATESDATDDEEPETESTE